MTKPTTTIPLDQYGLPARRLELPEGLFEELDRSWDAFVEQRAVTLAQQAHPKPVKPGASIPALPDEPDRGMTIVKWWKKWWDTKSEAGGWVETIWTIGMSLLSMSLIAGVFLDFDEFAEDTPFWGGLFLLLNPLWWSFLVDAIRKKGRWWITLPLLAVVVGMLRVYGLECDLDGSSHSRRYGDFHSEGYHLEDAERLWYFVSAFLLFLPTRLAWFWKKDTYRAKIRKIKEMAARIEEEWNKAVASHERNQLAELARQRGEIAIDPTQLFAFLQEGESTLWKKHKDAWMERLQDVTQAIAEGRVRLAALHGNDKGILAAKQEVIRSIIQMREQERLQIGKFQDQVAGSQEALKYVAGQIAGKLDNLREEQDLDAWLKKQRADHDVTTVALERSRVELQAAVAWFQNQLRHQDAALEAARELREPDAPVQLTDGQQREIADLEVARAVLDREPEV